MKICTIYQWEALGTLGGDPFLNIVQIEIHVERFLVWTRARIRKKPWATGPGYMVSRQLREAGINPQLHFDPRKSPMATLYSHEIIPSKLTKNPAGVVARHEINVTNVLGIKFLSSKKTIMYTGQDFLRYARTHGIDELLPISTFKKFGL